MKLDLENFVDNPEDWSVARIDAITGTIEMHEKGYVESYKVRQKRRAPVKYTPPELIPSNYAEMSEETRKLAWDWAHRFQAEFDKLEASRPDMKRSEMMHAVERAMRRKLRRKLHV